MKQSLQKIADTYARQGFSGARLRNILALDKKYQRILSKRRLKLTKSFPLSGKEAKHYVLSVDKDFEIYKKIKILDGLSLCKADREIVRLLRTQLEHDWRKPAAIFLGKMIKKYA